MDNNMIAKEMVSIAKMIVAMDETTDEKSELKQHLETLKSKLTKSMMSKNLSMYSSKLQDVSFPKSMLSTMTVGDIVSMLDAILLKDKNDEKVDELNDVSKKTTLTNKLKPSNSTLLNKKLSSFQYEQFKDLPTTMKNLTVKQLVDALSKIAEGNSQHTASVKVAGEVASKDGKYGTKSEGWNGTINYNGTRGIVSNAIFELKNGRIVWTDGTWHSGTWAYGLWKDGLWESGTWQIGEWENGIWMSGTWMYGTWHYGIWKQAEDKKSVWMNGTWKNGIWENGTHVSGWWEKGIWENGIWQNGTLWTGTWQNGIWNDGLNWYGEFQGGVWNKGQWNEGTWTAGTWNGGFDKKKVWHPAGASPNKWKVETK